MIFFYTIITALFTAALTKGAVECKIKPNETTGTQRCFAKLGEPLTFLILTNDKIYFKMNNMTILKANATFTIDMVRTTDSGNYQLETFNHEGLLSHKINLHLEVQAPVSKPEVSQMCLSPEQSVVCCSAEGDGVEFIWSLNNNILIQTRAESTDKLTSKVSNVTISLHGQLTGNLACITQNISREQTVIYLTSCKGSTCHPPFVTVTVAVIASVSTLLLLLAPFLYRRHLRKTPRPVTIEDNAGNEIVYSDVRVKPAKERRHNTK